MSDLPPPPPPPPPGNLTPPPGYVAYGQTAYGQGPLRRIAPLAKWLNGLLIGTLIMQVALLLVEFIIRSSAIDFVNNPKSTTFDSKFALLGGVGLIAGLVSVAQLVVLCILTFRISKNLQVLGRSPLAFRPGITILTNILGGCTLGIANYFMWRELWIGSDPTTAAGDPEWKRKPAAAIILTHLVLTLASVVIGITVGVASGFIAVRTSGSSITAAKNLANKIGQVGVTGVLQIAASVVFIMIMRQLAARHMQATRES
jgi:hypothetical protein